MQSTIDDLRTKIQVSGSFLPSFYLGLFCVFFWCAIRLLVSGVSRNHGSWAFIIKFRHWESRCLICPPSFNLQSLCEELGRCREEKCQEIAALQEANNFRVARLTDRLRQLEEMSGQSGWSPASLSFSLGVIRLKCVVHRILFWLSVK